MSKDFAAQRDIVSQITAAHRIRAVDGVGTVKIIIDRLEMHLGHPHGARLELGRVHALSTVRRRQPVFLLPSPPSLAISRPTEIETLRQTLLARSVVDLHGPDGAGKSTLSAAVAHTLDLNHFPDGAVFVNGPILYPDLLQVLFDSFYESDEMIKVTVEEMRAYLGGLRLLVILDGLGLGPKQIDPVLDSLDEASVLIVGAERTALGRGRALQLKGLPREAAVSLFETSLGRPFSGADGRIADQICSALNDMPLAIHSVGACAAVRNQPLDRLLTDLQGRKPWSGPGGDPSTGPALEQLVTTLDGGQRELVTLVAAFGATSASRGVLKRLTHLTDSQFQADLEHLEALGLLHAPLPSRRIVAAAIAAASDLRVALNSAYLEAVRSWLVDEAARKRAVDYYASSLRKGETLPAEELAGLLGAIQDCAQHGWLDPLKLMVRAADHSLAALRWWAEWGQLLDITRRAAQAGGDRPLEAWAMHQWGSLLGALGQYERAYQLLESATRIREALGDRVGAELCAHNLVVLEKTAPAPPQAAAPELQASGASAEVEGVGSARTRSESPETDTTSPIVRRKRRWLLRMTLVAAILLLSASALALRRTVNGGHSVNAASGLTVYWEFGDAWNALDDRSWTQQIRIVVEDGPGPYKYFINGKPGDELFDVVLPLCDGTQGTIRVQASDDQVSEVDFAFDSPYCR